jgi:hypothetical protein
MKALSSKDEPYGSLYCFTSSTGAGASTARFKYNFSPNSSPLALSL